MYARHATIVFMTTNAKTQVAIFDYDGTIISGQSGSLFSRYLLKHGLISKSTLARLLWWGTRYTLHLPYRQNESRELIFRDLGIRSQEEARQIMVDFHNEVLLPRYRAAAIAEAKRREEEGCTTLLLSATFYDIAKAAADYLGMDNVIATHMELDEEGLFTGLVAGEVTAAAEKLKVATAWANEHLGEDAWELAYAYADHFSDESLLAAAVHPCAVNPGPALRRIAKRNAWPIVNWK